MDWSSFTASGFCIQTILETHCLIVHRTQDQRRTLFFLQQVLLDLEKDFKNPLAGLGAGLKIFNARKNFIYHVRSDSSFKITLAPDNKEVTSWNNLLQPISIILQIFQWTLILLIVDQDGGIAPFEVHAQQIFMLLLASSVVIGVLDLWSLLEGAVDADSWRADFLKMVKEVAPKKGGFAGFGCSQEDYFVGGERLVFLSNTRIPHVFSN